MEYERIERPQRGGGGLSPAKLRSMLMGVEKKRRELLEEVDSSYSLRSQNSSIDDPGSDFTVSCKDVDVIREYVECSTSTNTDSEMIPDHKSKDQTINSSKIKSNVEFEEDYEYGHDNLGVVSSAFEFQKAERGQPRLPAAPFSKPAPSKWDDAQKWIASPTSNRPKTGQSHGVQGARKTNIFGHGGRKPATKVVHEVPDEKIVDFEEVDMKRMDQSLAKKANSTKKLVSWESYPYPNADLHGKTAHVIDNSFGEPEIHLSQHDSSISIQTSTALIPPTSFARSVSMRDMGTEMTPLASQEPSRTGTPVKVKSPMHSPTSSRSSTPKRAHISEAQTNMINDNLNLQRKELSEKEMHMKTRKEIMELGMQLGKLNIAAWAGKDVEERATSSSANAVAGEQVSKSVVETRAEVWEEAEKAKYMARFQREEMKIEAWENHQKAKTEAEIRKIEVEVERMKAKAQDKFMNKLAAARHKAEEKRAAAEEKMNKKAADAEQQAEYIRKTGQIPSKFSCFSCCC
ncbi:Remorin 4.1 [Bienertia sinuspersici]